MSPEEPSPADGGKPGAGGTRQCAPAGRGGASTASNTLGPTHPSGHRPPHAPLPHHMCPKQGPFPPQADLAWHPAKTREPCIAGLAVPSQRCPACAQMYATHPPPTHTQSRLAAPVLCYIEPSKIGVTEPGGPGRGTSCGPPGPVTRLGPAPVPVQCWEAGPEAPLWVASFAFRDRCPPKYRTPPRAPRRAATPPPHSMLWPHRGFVRMGSYILARGRPSRAARCRGGSYILAPGKASHPRPWPTLNGEGGGPQPFGVGGSYILAGTCRVARGTLQGACTRQVARAENRAATPRSPCKTRRLQDVPGRPWGAPHGSNARPVTQRLFPQRLRARALQGGVCRASPELAAREITGSSRRGTHPSRARMAHGVCTYVTR